MNEFKQFLYFALACIVAFVTIVASYGCAFYGVNDSQPNYYIIIGILNLGWLYFPGKYIYKVVKEHLKPKSE